MIVVIFLNLYQWTLRGLGLKTPDNNILHKLKNNLQVQAIYANMPNYPMAHWSGF